MSKYVKCDGCGTERAPKYSLPDGWAALTRSMGMNTVSSDWHRDLCGTCCGSVADHIDKLRELNQLPPGGKPPPPERRYTPDPYLIHDQHR